MSSVYMILRHPTNGLKEQTWEGFSWPALFFGMLWQLYKGLYGHFVICLVIAIVTAGFAAPIIWLAYAINGNDWHFNSLLKKGYLTEKQWENKEGAAPIETTSVADEILKLQSLRNSGALSEEEFSIAKQKLLA